MQMHQEPILTFNTLAQAQALLIEHLGGMGRQPHCTALVHCRVRPGAAHHEPVVRRAQPRLQGNMGRRHAGNTGRKLLSLA